MEFAARDVTNAEWESIKGGDYYRWRGQTAQQIRTNQAVKVTGNATTAYNCIAYSVGRTDRWIVPKSNLVRYYGMLGFEVREIDPDSNPFPKPGETVCIYSKRYHFGDVKSSTDHFTHAAVFNPDYGMWESKMGEGIRILHKDPRDLESEETSTGLGKVHYYAKKPPVMFYFDLLNLNMDYAQKILKFALDFEAANGDLVQDFVSKYWNWKQSLKLDYANVDPHCCDDDNLNEQQLATEAKKYDDALDLFSKRYTDKNEQWKALLSIDKALVPYIVSKLVIATERPSLNILLQQIWPDGLPRPFSSITDLVLDYDSTHQAIAMMKLYVGLITSFEVEAKKWVTKYYWQYNWVAQSVLSKDRRSLSIDEEKVLVWAKSPVTQAWKEFLASGLAKWIADKPAIVALPFVQCDYLQQMAFGQSSWWSDVFRERTHPFQRLLPDKYKEWRKATTAIFIRFHDWLKVNMNNSN